MKSYCNYRAIFKTLYAFLFITISFASTQQRMQWCWTKSMVNEPSFKLDEKKGGFNWGFCDNANSSEKKIKEFTAIVETSSLINSGTSSEIFIQLFGDKGEGEKVTLNKDGFDRGRKQELKFQSLDVGDLQRIKIFLKGQQHYRCKEITIINSAKTYKFSCLRALSPCNNYKPDSCELAIDVDGYQPYKIIITTGDSKQDETHVPVHFTLIGEKGIGQEKVISEHGFKSGESGPIHINTNPIGNIVGVKLALESEGKWKPIKISVKDLLTQKIKDFELDKITLRNPGNSPYTHNPSDKPDPIPDPLPVPAPAPTPLTEKFNVNDPNGGLMSLKDKSQIIDLKCEQNLIDPDPQTNFFGPDYPTKDVNYSTIVVRCPSNCHKKKDMVVFGFGIHPRESPICLSAIVDNAMSLYGGIFSVSLFSGYENYSLHPNLPTVQHGITIKDFGPSKKSYVLAKIDSVDLVKKDMRILNADGELSSKGRLEMRYEGVWETVCSLGNDKNSAKVICRDIGYKDGKWENPEGQEGKDFCRRYDGKDYCGAEIVRSIFSKVTCWENHRTFNECQKELADPNICSHNFDAIINCYDEDFTNPTTIPDYTIRLESTLKNPKSSIGRLELYLKGKFEPVCHIGFHDNSAQIACKQMGYLGGKMYEDEISAAAYQLSDKGRGFNAINLKCDGHEAVISECKSVINDISCQHDQDVVIECFGVSGDSSGKSQYRINGPVPVPKLGKLGLPSRKIDCNTKGYDIMFRGDPGTLYLLTCPANCGEKSGVVWGTGMFTNDSHICKAGLHGGILGQNGGQLLFIKSFGQKDFFGSSQNGGYLSADFKNSWSVSYSLSSINSAWLNMANLMSSDNRDNSFIEEKFSLGFLSNKNTLPEYTSSFLELNTNNAFPKPVLKWTPPSYTFKFDKNTNISDISLLNSPDKLKDYTMILKFELRSWKNERAFLMSYGCGGFNIFISETGLLMFGDYCDKEKLWIPGYNVPLNDSVSIYLRYNNGNSKVTIKSLKSKEPFEALNARTDLHLENIREFAMGRINEGKGRKEHFYGSISYLFFFNGDVSIETLKLLTSELKIENHNAVEPFSSTIDKRECVSRCSDNPTPPNPGCGETPKDADLNQPQEILDPKLPKDNDIINKLPKDNDIINPNVDIIHNDIIIPNDDIIKPNKNDKTDIKVNDLEALILSCESTLLENKFKGKIGTIFRADCPNCSNDNKNLVYGTSIYHPKSSICKAALHKGVLKKGEKGTVLVTILGATFKGFQASEGEDGSFSLVEEKSDEAFNLQVAPPVTKITCKSKANQREFESFPTGKEFVLKCPKKCSKVKQAVYGTEIYTDTSSICKAAIHGGIISDLGGEVKIAIAEGKKTYEGSNGFGILSKDFGPHVRSFRFLGKKAAISFQYKEDYSGKFNDKWHLEKFTNVDNKDSDNWDFFEDKKFIDPSGKNINLQAIRHTGKIDTKAELDFASWVTLKDQEWANGTVKFNFLIKSSHTLGFLFRYQDSSNYYAISFQPNSKKIKLISKIEGVKIVHQEKPHTISLNTWYRVRVNYEYESIKVTMQSANIIEYKKIFKTTLKNIHRGTIGFATKVTGISIDKYESNKNNYAGDTNKFTWNSITTQVSLPARRIYCTEMFIGLEVEIIRCIRPHMFCKYKCDSLIKRIENIRNYACFVDCIRQTKIENAIEAPAEKEQHNFLTWNPKRGDKCDYQPSGRQEFVPCEVKELKQTMKEKFARLSYKTSNGEREVWIKYPSPDFLKCGVGIKIRNDCK